MWNHDNSPTNHFTILEPQDQEIGEFYLVQERRGTDFKAPKSWKDSSGQYGLEKKAGRKLVNWTNAK